MKLKLEIDMDNSAFEEPGEIQNIIEQLAQKLAGASQGEHGSVRDSNGNTVGSWSIE